MLEGIEKCLQRINDQYYHNNSTDLAIGAHSSNTVYLYRCIPTIQMHVAIKVPDAMNLPQNATNFTALFCVQIPPKNSWPRVKIGKFLHNLYVII